MHRSLRFLPLLLLLTLWSLDATAGGRRSRRCCSPARCVPVQCVPVQCVPVQCLPVQCLPVQCLPVQCVEVRGAPVSSPPPQLSAPQGEPAAPPQSQPSAGAPASSRSLFDGATLTGWKRTNFGGEGQAVVKDGALILEMGYPLTGVTSEHKDLPKTDYELSLEAQRVEGGDFFCGLTFPVDESFCSLILGGWGGAVVGLSSIDDADASENATTRYMKFESGRWYKVRVRVTRQNISAWLDDEQIVDQEIEGHKISTRIEVGLSQPLGICAYETKAAIRGIRLRKLDASPMMPQVPSSQPPQQPRNEID